MHLPIKLLLLLAIFATCCFAFSIKNTNGKESQITHEEIPNVNIQNLHPRESRDPDPVEESFANHGIGSDEVYFWSIFGFFLFIVALVFFAPSK